MRKSLSSLCGRKMDREVLRVIYESMPRSLSVRQKLSKVFLRVLTPRYSTNLACAMQALEWYAELRNRRCTEFYWMKMEDLFKREWRVSLGVGKSCSAWYATTLPEAICRMILGYADEAYPPLFPKFQKDHIDRTAGRQQSVR
jgi:hypothetical protein